MGKFTVLEEALHYTYSRYELLELALTHSSWASEQSIGQAHNERQEFLGDAVLELCVSWELFSRFPEAREGDLTRLRSKLVCTEELADLARELGIDAFLKLGKGEESQGGRARDSVLSDVFEAVIASVFEDGGFAAATGVVQHVFRHRWPQCIGNSPPKDYKSRLQIVMQHVFKEHPVYTLEKSDGPEHAKVFHVSLTLPNGVRYTAQGVRIKFAEQEAAKKALQDLQGSDSAD